MFRESSLVGFGLQGDYLANPISWWRHAESLYDAPLNMSLFSCKMSLKRGPDSHAR
jgi:hypothetical protein